MGKPRLRKASALKGYEARALDMGGPSYRASTLPRCLPRSNSERYKTQLNQLKEAKGSCPVPAGFLKGSVSMSNRVLPFLGASPPWTLP